ncbi:hypothetical protein HDV00_006252 [Rhizophlyctis rosea]|nr:hypothetical protein HDV00_006252 [Rhizophlyctis rosea]
MECSPAPKSRVDIQPELNSVESSFTEQSSWTKLDILSSLCNSVLLYGRTTEQSSETVPSSVANGGNAHIGGDGTGRTSRESTVSLPKENRPSEYDHRSFDHSELLSELSSSEPPSLTTTPSLGSSSSSPSTPNGLDNLAAVALGTNAATNLFGSTASAAATLAAYSNLLYPGSFENLAAAALGPLLESSTSAMSDLIRYTSNPFGMYGGMPSSSYDAPPVKRHREPNPLDDFAAITDTVRKMEDEATNRARKRRAR